MQNFAEEFSESQFQVIAFYCFTALTEEEIGSLQKRLTTNALEAHVRGTVILASEGVNGTICGTAEGVTCLLDSLKKALSGNALELKLSWTPKQVFRRFKARRKCEIVTMGVGGINPKNLAGKYVDPLNWNSYLSDSETLVIDTRNEYEVAIGSFQGAVNPNTHTFREFPSWVENNLRFLVNERRPKRIAMFCTGGIRCEKATSFLLKEGFQNIHHLRGGILKYLEVVPKKESLWDGECFVFDRRVALNHNLLPGVHRLCHACGSPLTPEQQQDSSYVRGIQCSYCKDRYSDKDRARFAERQKQIDHRAKQLLANSVSPY